MWHEILLLLPCIIGSVLLSDTTQKRSNLSENVLAKQNTSQNLFENAYYPAVDWSDEFDWRLFKVLEPRSSNLLISPLSLKVALVALYEGAEGNTKNELESVLRLDSKEAARARYSRIIQGLQNGDGINDLRLGSRLFLDLELTPYQKYSSNIEGSYHINLERTNFVIPEAASKQINEWVRSATNERILNIVEAGDLDDVVLLIANAIFFKGFWKNAFPTSNSKIGNFYVTPNSTVSVDYMNRIGKFLYSESRELEAQILRIPYKGNAFGFFIILPNSRGGLQKLVNSLTLQKLKRNIYTLDHMTVDVTIPKFKFDYTCSCASALRDLGLREMFLTTASFPEIAREYGYGFKKLLVSDVVQKSGIEINEEGSVIFSATDIEVGNKFGNVDLVFNASHPFMFFVEHEPTGSILFIGKVENPLAGSTPDSLPVRFSEEETNAASGHAADDLSPGLSLSPVAPSDNKIQSRFNYFDLELLRTLGNDFNYMISPASLKIILGMLLEGARGKTAEEIGEVLRIPVSQDGVRDKLDRLLYDLNDVSGATILQSANALFLSNNISVASSYGQVLTTVYHAMVTSVNFSKTQESANVINKWVTDATKGLIPTLVDEGSPSPDTSVVIANALYFKGKWKEAFNPKGTYTHTCFNVKGTCFPTLMMHNEGIFNYKFIDELDADAVELPYSDGRYAMLILLPSEKSSVDSLIRDLQHVSFPHIIDRLESTEIIIEIPKFELEYSTDVIPALKLLGIREIFSQNADLSGIAGGGNIKVDGIIHKTKLEVNEEGTVAAAATGAEVVPLMGSTIPEIVANRPFLFFIYHVGSRNVIFEGRFNQPKDALPLTQQVYSSPSLNVSSIKQIKGFSGTRKVQSLDPGSFP